MPAAPQSPEKIDHQFTLPLIKENGSGWICVVVPKSGEIFGTRKAVKIGGTIDGQDFQATMLPLGDGTHMMPVKAALRKSLKKDVGDDVKVHLSQRFS
ncbi:DUF1905 domain-containing protein [Amycolatopsis regifaucium]|uniref:DUF1905 domain-containing protein n=1 Tax=Amycolatopsis regifaucium TaxID=546365 RepID=A0A154MU43_9PSEU|nr:DUF1905 domain-containing protein [Amycolatopsis regifaucium]KZB87443.1 hypothetical protein AVL48_22660 [Amycolatopsis regifaucium]OKA08281.1 hypothetical protein ATP06_0213435 [Amycolatopsis regifaucium]SFI05417.1 protein of unknown function [Amycolatopsis regifaucium]